MNLNFLLIIGLFGTSDKTLQLLLTEKTGFETILFSCWRSKTFLKVRSIGAHDVSIGSSVDASAFRFKYDRMIIK